MTSRRITVNGYGAAGFSTVGMIIALVLLGLILSPMVGTVLSAQRFFVTSQTRVRVTGSARYAHLALTRSMRIAGSNPVGGFVAGVDPDPDGNGLFDDVRLRADYNPADGDIKDPGEDVTYFVRADTMYIRPDPAGEEEPYLLGVDSLAFEYFDRFGDPITDPETVTQRAISARVTLRATGETFHERTDRVLMGEVRLRNGR